MRLESEWDDTVRYNTVSILLGVGNLCVWAGLLRYLGFFHKYNILILTLKRAIPNVLRFMLCALILYGGFCLCGWLVLGPYHMKFRTLSLASECLFSLMNGDDMFATFYTTDARSQTIIWWFSRLYLYLFVCLFIYVVLSLFIALIMDSYETIKDFYENGLPLNDLQKFIAECSDESTSRAYLLDRETTMPRYEDSPAGHRSGGHSPLDHRGGGGGRGGPDHRRMKSPIMGGDGRRGGGGRPQRDSPSMRPSMNSRDNNAYDDYRNHSGGGGGGHHRSGGDGGPPGGGGGGVSMPYKILCVSNISNKYSDNEVRNALTREFHRFGEPNVKLVYDDNTRLAYLYFDNYDDARDGRHAKSRLILFDKTVVIDPIYDRTIQMPRRRSISPPDYQMGGGGRRGGGGGGGGGGRGPPSPPMPRGRGPPPPQMGRNSMNDMKYNMQSHRENYRDMHSMHRNNDYHHSGGGGGAGGGGGGGGGGGNSRQHHQQQNQQQQQQHRESKKEKFPNYLHHVAPEEDDKSTRTLFVGNLEVTITDADLRRIFERYGVVEDID
ncbi:unnamed protein product, partial [Oppiella nova]